MASILVNIKRFTVTCTRELKYHGQIALRMTPRGRPTACRLYAFQFHLSRGRVLYQLGQYDKAVSDFRMALRLNWRHAEAASWVDKAQRVSKRAMDERNSQMRPWAA
jgi:tetratricopeptide (TPR) repeat protein